MRTVLFDVDTQLDFISPAGALHAPGAERIVPNLARFTRFASERGITIISTVDAHTENDPEFREWKPHCVAGTVGQQKVASSLTPNPVTIASRAGAFVAESRAAAPQFIVEKQHVDCFSNPNLSTLLDALGPSEFVVYGVVTEVCVFLAAVGLLRLGKRVTLVTDAIHPFSPEKGVESIRQLRSEGALVITAAQLIG